MSWRRAALGCVVIAILVASLGAGVAFTGSSRAETAGFLATQGGLYFFADGTEIHPEYFYQISTLPSTVIFDYEVKNYLLRVAARSAVPSDDVIAGFDPAYWKTLAAQFRIPGGSLGTTISFRFARIDSTWSYASLPLSATLDFPLTREEYEALSSPTAGGSASAAVATGNGIDGRVQPMGGKRTGGGGPAPIPCYYNGYVQGQSYGNPIDPFDPLSHGGYYGQKDVFVTARSGTSSLSFYGWTNTKGYFQIFIDCKFKKSFDALEIRYRGGSSCYSGCIDILRYLYGPLIGQQKDVWFYPADGLYRTWYPKISNQSGWADVARVYLGKDSAVPLDPLTYFDTKVSWEVASTRVKLEGSAKSIAIGYLKYGRTELGWESDFSESYSTFTRQQNSFDISSAVTYKYEWLHEVTDLAGTKYGVIEHRSTTTLSTLGRPGLVDEVSATDAWNSWKAGSFDSPTHLYDRMDLTSAGGARLPFSMGARSVVSGRTDTARFDWTIVDLNLLVVRGNVHYRSATTTSNSVAYSVEALLTQYIPSDGSGNGLYKVLVWVSPSDPLKYHVYLVPNSWT